MKTTNEKIELKDKNGKNRIGRKISVSSTFNCSPEIMWEKLLDIETLIEICKPKASFKSVSKMPEKWEENVIYKFKLFIYGFIPFGKHEILLENIDQSRKEIQSKEHNKIVRIWNHLIILNETQDGKTFYTDIVELHSGIFTYFTALWSIGFYKHRQKKWNKIIERSGKESKENTCTSVSA
ncbi:MAG: hypothetical protein LBP67_02595 [Bacteroidales bacterium]|jgi:hypothetical protein|nr:hypothetical protein [Bacteroidales bacterium]